MKVLLITLFIFVIIYCVYYDLKTGTLPREPVTTAQKDDSSVLDDQQIDEPYVDVKVKPGDTVLTLLEQHQSGSLPVSISKVVTDFQNLNNGVAPEKMQIGRTYKIPLYK